MLESASGRRLAKIRSPLVAPLRLGLYQLLFLDRVPGFSAVDLAVGEARRRIGRAGAGFVNTVLRKVAARPELAMRLASVLAGRVRALSDQLEAMKFETIGQRVIRWLQTHGAGLREIRTTHQDLAAQVGSNRENVSRVLGLLRDQGLLRLGRGSIEILDHQALARADLGPKILKPSA